LQQPFAHAESLATGWQEPLLQALQTLQVVAEPAVHTPFWQLSPGVQASLSALQPTPSGLAGLEQLPVLDSQVPAS
jgi:hypothetical protein